MAPKRPPADLEAQRKKRKIAQQTRRQNEQYRKQEKLRDAEARRNCRLHRPDQAANTAAFAARMKNPVLKQQYQDVNQASQERRRENQETQRRDQVANTAAFAARMKNPLLKRQYQDINQASQERRRENEIVRQTDRINNATVQAERRAVPGNLASEQARQNQRRQKRGWNQVVQTFNSAVSDGPQHTCFSCDRLFFRRSITTTTKQKLLSKAGTNCTEEFLEQVVMYEHYSKPEWQFCRTCYQSIGAKTPKLPKLNINQSWLRFPEIDSKITELTPLERRLVSPRIPFMKIFALGCDRQFGIRGGIVNVPVNVPEMFQSVPINPNQANVIHLKLKRKTTYRSDYMYERIRPKAVYEAAKVLCESPLYRNNDPPIELHTNWELRNEEETIFDADSNNALANELTTAMEVDEEIGETEEQQNSNDNQEPPSESNENYIHIDEETLIDTNNAVAFAPGEGQIPMPVWLDDNCEEFAFPNIFGGNPRNVNPAKRLSYNEIINSEIRRTDRRAVEPDHLLFIHKKSQLKQLSDTINIQMKKAVQNNITASQALNNAFINDAISKDNAFRCLRNITGSPSYWEHQKKNVMAMVRQFGICTFFVTMSAAETKWEDLLKILMKTVHGIEEADISQLTFEQKAELIRKDPVTCALYFDHRFKEVKKTWFNTLEGPFGQYKIKHMYHRIEFQHRGSPHVHMLLWLEDAPKYDPSNNENIDDICDFIDSIMSTDSQDPDVEQFIAYQRHKCTKTCHKTVRGKARCRFGAPFPPMRKTMILTPLNEDLTNEQKKELKAFVDKMNDILDSQTIQSFDELMEKLECDEDMYIRAIRSQLNVNKVFLKRAVQDCRVNQYCKKIIMCMQSNMDIQYILDPYACINYIVEYINKPARGISRLLRECVENLRAGNNTIRHQLRCVCNCFYNGCEICAQEAAWCRLRLLMSVCSVAVEFINTGRSDNRHRILKSQYELNKLPPDSQNIFLNNMIDRYADRPASLENCCLADFIAEFTFKGKSKRGKPSNEDDEEDVVQEQPDEAAQPDDVNEDGELRGQNNVFPLKDGTLRRRRNPKVIRFCRFDIRKDAVEFFRERIMLFKPWRDEQTEIENVNHEVVFNQNKAAIEANSKKYIALDIDIEEVLRQIEEVRNQEQADSWDEEADPHFVNVYEPSDDVPEPNILFDVGRERTIQIEAKKYNVPDMFSTDDYLALCDSLNVLQRDYFMDLISTVKEGKGPQYHFISGGAGVGKSRLIMAMYQALIRIYRKDAGPAGKPEVLLVAPTGKAAHNIGGSTAHHAFGLKFGAQHGSERFTPPSAEKLNTMRTELSELKFIIIDEISMLGASNLQKVHLTLNVIFKNNDAERIFGGIPVIVVGDFNQLHPVRDEFCFMPVETNPLNVIAGNPLWKKFSMFELTQIMRQREDSLFAEALNRLAIGNSTLDDMSLFNQHVYTEGDLPEEGKSAVRLIYENKDVESYNDRRMLQLRTNNSMCIVSKAIDIFPNNISNDEKAEMVNSLAKKPAAQTQGLQKSLPLQIGVHYMISSNVDVADGLFNGAIGILRHYEVHTPTSSVTRVFLEFDDPKIGQQARTEYLHYQSSNATQLDPSWIPLARSKISFAVTRKYYNQVMRTQFPLVVAEAITIHKSQGSTFEKVTVQIPNQNVRSLIYVALSRATKLENLFMVGTKLRRTKPPQPNDKIMLEMNRLRTEAQFIPKFTYLRQVPPGCIQIVSNNIRSLVKHINTVRVDSVFSESHIVLLQETWLHDNCDTSLISIPGKSIISRNKLREGHTKGKGTIIYATHNTTISNSTSVDRESRWPIDITVCVYSNITIINLYRSDSASEKNLEDALDKIKDYLSADNILVCGDFNVDLASTSYGKTIMVKRQLAKHYLELISPLEPTTDNGNTIDGVFGRLKDYNVEVKIYESYASDHKPIVVRLRQKQIPSSGLSQPFTQLNC